MGHEGVSIAGREGCHLSGVGIKLVLEEDGEIVLVYVFIG
jgi:hypothetical protein